MTQPTLSSVHRRALRGDRLSTRRAPASPLAAALLCAALQAGCGGEGGPSAPPPPPRVEKVFDFALGTAGWLGADADYGPDTAPTDVISETRFLPAPFSGSGLYSAGTNRSDDLFVYVKTRVDGLAPGTAYRVSARIEFLTDVPQGCIGVGGAPGESVWIVFATAATEPLTVFDGTDYRVNLDRGNQSTGGTQGIVLGNLANSVTECGPRAWETKTVTTPAPTPLGVTADVRGEAWILVGFDSGYEAFSQLYYRRFRVEFTPVE
jgi:hypothetical protein